MDSNIKAFLSQERISALTILLPDGSMHSAAMHFSMSEEPFELYFSTDQTSRKAGLVKDTVAKASFVTGFSEEVWKTLQIDGEIRKATDEAEIAKIKAIHYAKNPGSQRFEGDPNTIFMVFTPKWWRYTDFMQDPLLKVEGSK